MMKTVIRRKKLSGTKEWSNATMNCFAGCDNGCKYCYAQSRKIQLRMLTAENRNTPVERDWGSFVSAFKGVCRELKGEGTIMFPSTHDISPKKIDCCLKALDYMLEGSNYKFLIVSKPWLECVSRMCDALKYHKDRIMFRFTIGSADDSILKFWEPDASTFGERVDCVKYAFDQ